MVVGVARSLWGKLDQQTGLYRAGGVPQFQSHTVVICTAPSSIHIHDEQ